MASLFIVERFRTLTSRIDIDFGLTSNRYTGRSPVQNAKIQDNSRGGESRFSSDRTQILL